GSRALMVSHCPVASDAAVQLTTGMINYTTQHPNADNTVALQKTMPGLILDKKTPPLRPPHFLGPVCYCR
ncbi:MAG: hypothetical protein ACKVIF_14745, partial [Rhodospirillales bacterium]